MTPIVYGRTAEEMLVALPPSDALRIVEAVERFAMHGVGFVRRMLGESDETRLYLDGYYVTFARSEGFIRVLTISKRP